MRVVLDTNVLVRAATPGSGPAREVLRLIRTGPHCLVTSAFLLSELERVLNYPRLRERHQMSHERMRQFIEDYHEAAEVVDVGIAVGPISSDPDDDPVIHTTVAGRADVLCTLDRHLRRDAAVHAYCGEHGIRILDDVALLAELRAGEGA